MIAEAPLSALARFVRPRRPTHAGIRCELCASELISEHEHVADLEARTLRCACRPCALLLTQPGAAKGRYRAVPDRLLRDTQFHGNEAWSRLGIPVGLAFFFRDSRIAEPVASYPGPAGVTESVIEAPAWDALCAATPLANQLAPDVEALLLRARRGATAFDCYLVPITECYRLAGMLRKEWKGFDGGTRAWEAIDEFFAEVARRARTLPGGWKDSGTNGGRGELG